MKLDNHACSMEKKEAHMKVLSARKLISRLQYKQQLFEARTFYCVERKLVQKQAFRNCTINGSVFRSSVFPLPYFLRKRGRDSILFFHRPSVSI
jgi:hypothetical protein